MTVRLKVKLLQADAWSFAVRSAAVRLKVKLLQADAWSFRDPQRDA